MTNPPAAPGSNPRPRHYMRSASKRSRRTNRWQPRCAGSAADPALQAKAEQFVERCSASIRPNIRARQDGKSAIENMGLDLQRRAAQKSQMLKQPVKKLTERTQEGGDVGNALIDLKMKVEEIDPGEIDFEAGWFTRLIGQLPASAHR